jgi:DNA-binding NarL/FixJ family response regulator
MGVTPPSTNATVVIVDDHRMFAESLARLLSDDEAISVLDIAANGDDGIDLVTRLDPDVVLVDFHLPDRDGVEVAIEIKKRNGRSMVVMLTSSTQDSVLLAAIEAGCSGFLTKDGEASTVSKAVLAAAAGEALISPAQLARLLPKLSRAERAVSAELTPRERDLLERLARGQANKEIAAQLHLSLNTVRNYVQTVLTKLDAHSKLEAVSTAVRQGIIDYPTGP